MLTRGAMVPASLDNKDCIQRPSCALAGHMTSRGNGRREEDSFDDVEEDDITDDEDCYMLHKHFLLAKNHKGDDTQQEEDEADRLLSFANQVNKDINKLFHKKDSCNIYEDRWKRGKSGRELYYADLLRIAQGEDMEEKTYSGRMDRKMGLGPLKELFETNGIKRVRSSRRQCHTIPMKDRELPASFWKEPIIKRTISAGGEQQPDFSDLLESWGMVGMDAQHTARGNTGHS